LERAINEGAKLIANEFKQFLEIRQIARRRYIEIMKTLIKPSRWSEVKRSLRIISNVSDKQISNYLKELMYYGFIEKRDDLYFISDFLLVEAIRRGYIQ
jgi:predicted transcriptional regulator